MGYQPIQMPGLQIPDFAGTILRAREAQRQEEANRWSQLRDQGVQEREDRAQAQQIQHQQFEDQRQQQADREQALSQIHDLYQKGLGHQAKQIAQLHGYTFAPLPNTAQAPTAPQMPQQPQAPEQGPLPATPDMHSQQMQAERDAFPAADAAYQQQAAQFPQAQGQYLKDKAQFDERAAHPLMQFSAPGARAFTVDPLEAQHAQESENERRAGLIKNAFAADPTLAPFASEFSARAATGLEKPDNIFIDLRQRQQAQIKAAEDARKEAEKEAHAKEFSPLAFDQAKELARINAGGHVAAASAGKQEAANDRVFTLLDRRAKALRDSTQFTKLVQGDKTVRGLFANIADGTVPLQHADAQIQLARYFRQAQPTEGEMHLLYNRLGGTMDKWNQFVSNMESGDLSPEQLRQVSVSAQSVKREDAEDKKRFVEVARKYLGPKSGLDMVPDQAQNLFEGMAAELGLNPAGLPPLYETQGGVTLGTGRKPAVQAKPKAGEAAKGEESDADFLRRIGIK